MSGPGITWATVEDALQLWASSSTGLPGTSCIWQLQGAGRPVDVTQAFITLRVMSVQRVGLDWRNFEDTPLSFSPIAVTGVLVSPTSQLAAPAHGLKQGDGPVQVASSGSVPAGLVAATNYWAIPVDSSHLQLASTFLNAWAPTPITITGAGTGTITIVSVADTRRAGAELTARSRGMRRVTVSIQCFGGNAEGAASPVSLLDAMVTALPKQASALRVAGVGVLNCGQVGSTQAIVDATVLEPRATLTLTLSLKSEVQDPETYIERVIVTPNIDGVDQPPQTWTLD